MSNGSCVLSSWRSTTSNDIIRSCHCFVILFLRCLILDDIPIASFSYAHCQPFLFIAVLDDTHLEELAGRCFRYGPEWRPSSLLQMLGARNPVF